MAVCGLHALDLNAMCLRLSEGGEAATVARYGQILWGLLCQVKKSLRGRGGPEAKRSTAEDKGLRGTGEMKQQSGQRQV